MGRESREMTVADIDSGYDLRYVRKLAKRLFPDEAGDVQALSSLRVREVYDKWKASLEGEEDSVTQIVFKSIKDSGWFF